MVVLVPSGQGSVVIHRLWGGRRGSHAAHTSRHSSQSEVWLTALGHGGSQGDARGSRTRWTPAMAVTSCVCRKVCTLSRASGAGRGWREGGGPVGRGVALPRSVPLPSLGRQQSGCHWRHAVHGGCGPPYHSGLCSPAFSGRDLCGVLARWRGLACSPRPPWELAAGAGGQVALQLLSRTGGGPSPLPRGVGAGAPAACGPVGGWGGGGGAAASLLPFWVAACGTQSWPLSCCRRTPFRRARAVRVAVPSRVGGG